MSQYRVVPYTPDRLPGLEQLWSEYLDSDAAVAMRRMHFRWLAEGNPCLAGESPYYLLLDGDRVIGMHGHMPQSCTANGHAGRLYLAHDDLLAAECRGKGLGKLMLTGVTAMNDSFAVALWHNAPNRKLYAKCGWRDCSELVSCALVIDPRPRLEKRFGRNLFTRALSAALRSALKARRTLRPAGRERSYRVTELTRFEAGFDALFDRAAAAMPFAVARTSAYLNWKFVEKPGNAYRRFAALDSVDVPRAYVVVSAGEGASTSTGRVLDLLGDPEHPGALDAAVRQSLDWLEAQGVGVVTSVGSSRAMSPLGRSGFRLRDSTTGFMMINWDAAFEEGLVTDIGNWYVTASDADGDAWNSG